MLLSARSHSQLPKAALLAIRSSRNNLILQSQHENLPSLLQQCLKSCHLIIKELSSLHVYKCCLTQEDDMYRVATPDNRNLGGYLEILCKCLSFSTCACTYIRTTHTRIYQCRHISFLYFFISFNSSAIKFLCFNYQIPSDSWQHHKKDNFSVHSFPHGIQLHTHNHQTHTVIETNISDNLL